MTEPKSPWSLWALIGFAVSALAWVAYARGLPGGTWGLSSDADRERGTTLRFVLDFEQARRQHRLAEDETNEQAFERTVRVVEARARKVGGAGVDVYPVGEDKLDVFVPS